MSLQLTTSGTTGSVKIAQRLALLLFTIVKTGTTSASTAQTAAGLINIEIKRETENGEKSVWPKGFLLNTGEIMTHALSAINTTNDGTDTTIKFSLSLVDERLGGSLNFNDNEKLNVLLSEIPSGVTVEIRSIEWPGDAKAMYIRDYVFAGQDVRTGVNVAGARFAAATRSKNTAMGMEYPGGRNIELSPAEVQDLMDNHKYCSYNDNGLITPGGKLLNIMDVDSALKLFVSQSSNDKIELLKVVPV